MTAVIAAAGSGERLGAGGPKAFVALGGRPMIAWSLDACLACEAVAAVVVAVPRATSTGSAAASASPSSTAARPGPSRSRTPWRRSSTEQVAIHDAARPLLTAALLDDLVAELAADPEADAIIAAAPVTDTVKKVRREIGVVMRDRKRRARRRARRSIARARGGRRRLRSSARRRCARRLAVDATVRDAATDEAMLVEAAGGTVLLHDPGAANLKVTTPLDLRVAELLLAERS